MFSTNGFIRYFNQNRRKILRAIIIIVGVIVVIQTLNAMAGMKQKNAPSIEQNTNTERGKVYQPNKTILTNTTLNDNIAQNNNESIDKFVNYCLNGNINDAYDMLTQECKGIYYKDVSSFNNNYCKKISNKKEYNIQSWMNEGSSCTYKVRYTEDILSTGSSNADAIEDYITIVNENGENRLNINSYIKRVNVNRKTETKDIEFNTEYKDIYINYEEYKIKIKNNTDNDILIDTLEDTEGIKLVGENNNVEYQALTNELSIYDVTIPSKNSKTINIKFTREYNPRRNLQFIKFKNVILNKEQYFKNNKDLERIFVDIKV